MYLNKIKNSLQSVNLKFFAALLVMGLCPTIYTTLRVFFLGQLPGDWAYSIAGQLSWVNLIYEIISEAIILPLFFFMGSAILNKDDFSNKLKTGLIVSGGIYTILSIGIILFTEPLLTVMAASPDIIKESATYIRIESIANVAGVLLNFVLVALIAIGRDKLVYVFTVLKLAFCVVTDTFLISTLPFSFNLGVNGIGYSNIIVNTILTIVILVILSKEGYLVCNKQKLSFAWCKDFFKIGSVSGLESFVRNIAYMLMVSRMVNVVGESGVYWVANNFIWGWMLLPVLQLGELIKQEVSTDKNKIKTNTLGYFTITTFVCILWVVTIPLYKPFMQYVLNYSDVDKLFHLVMILFVFYIAFAYQNIFDMTFYGRGKTNYMLFESVVTNSIYYGGFFIAYKTGLWIPSLDGIALMFGVGTLFDAIVSGIAYRYYLRRYMIPKSEKSLSS